MCGVIITAISMQHAHYLPRTFAGCYPYFGPEAVTDMFRRMHPEDPDSVSQSCATWVGQWVVGVVMV